MKKVFVAGVMFGAIAAFYCTPFYTVYQMQHAAKARDATALNTYIDYPAVRESLKTALQSDMSNTLLQGKTDNGMNAFAKLFASAFVNPLVDVLVTPNSVSLMLQADMPKPFDRPKAPDSSTNSATQAHESDKNSEEDLVLSRHYSDINHFVVTVAKPQSPNAAFTFTLSRDGLLGWKLTGIAIPPTTTTRS